MRARRKIKHETEQERIELEEQAAHEAGECRGYPWCYLCIDEKNLDDMVTYTIAQLDKEK